MDGVSKVFCSVMDMKTSNIHSVLTDLEEHQTLWAEPKHEIDGYFAKIGSLLGIASTRDRGLVALKHFVPQCPLDVLEDKMQYYINICAKICNQKGHQASVPLAYGVLKQLLNKSLQSTDLNKLMVSNIPKLLESISTAINPSLHVSVLDFLETAMRSYPGVTGMAKNRIEDFLYSLVDSEDTEIVKRTASCLLLLQQIRGGGQHGSLHKKTWDEYQCKLVNTVHELLGQVFAHIPETFDVEENLECLKFPKLVVNEEPVTGAHQTVRRLINVIHYLEAAILEPYPVAKPIRPMKVLNVIFRAHSVSCVTMGKTALRENLALGMMLPQVQLELLRVLDALVLVLKSNALPFGNLVTDLFDQCLKGTLTTNSKGQKKSFLALRVRVYESIVLWCDTLHYASGVEEIADNLLEHIVQDITPFEPEVTLQVNASGQKLSAKAKRKLQKEQNASTSLVKCHSTDGIQRKHSTNDSGNDLLCRVALRCLTSILQSAGCFVKPVMQKLLQEKIVQLCFNVFAQINLSSEQNLFSEFNCRRALLTALNALVVNPHHLCPPPLQYAAQLFNVAEVHDPNLQVRRQASQLARSVETLLHPRKEVFYFPVEENAVKDMLIAKKKHPLNAAFPAKRDYNNLNKSITFDDVEVRAQHTTYAQENESPETSSESEPEREQIAEVVDVTMEENGQPKTVPRLNVEMNEIDLNCGELHKSINDKTVESQAIEIDSDDEIEVIECNTSENKKNDPYDRNSDVELVEESPQQLDSPGNRKSTIEEKALPQSLTPNSAKKRKVEKELSCGDVENKLSKPSDTEDLEARVDDLVAEFVDELNDEI
ncbi:proline-, glutamic acid- and leucine-rich protein 1-like [Uranotaenia lowii]|uniref:proline-, glutamic acid- and leucine-rich protein 1-like n=1 Tax=Uranotaenia lowii TaxID=190385 RepID=UPI00247A8916|nr:proline-, glutamic acid- and leucine-rich protein 1-like [Uranotaenia lowii]